MLGEIVALTTCCHSFLISNAVFSFHYHQHFFDINEQNEYNLRVLGLI